ncbi:hypothetical protein SBA6_890015 [Candidatus Sulfopaludibacter sp. SbA6]|nr:hypothetical protein SBA6_890015 [Candidatus Sulfopaludibacter sp. SbA6]
MPSICLVELTCLVEKGRLPDAALDRLSEAVRRLPGYWLHYQPPSGSIPKNLQSLSAKVYTLLFCVSFAGRF